MIKFLRGKPSLGFGGGSITVRKKETKIPYPVLEYIQGTGNVYIPTDYIAKDNTTFEFKFRSDIVSAEYESLFGSRTMVFERKESRTNTWQFTRGSYDTFSGKYSLIGEDWVQGQAYVVTIKGVDANNSEVYRDGILKLSFDRPLRDGYPLTLFSNSDGGRISKMRLYYFKIYEGKTLVHNYIPVLLDSGIATLYDTVTKVVLSVSGTGGFVVPPASLAIRYSLPEETVFPGNNTGTMIDTGISQADMSNGYCIAMVITPTAWSSYRGIFGYHESTSQGLCGLQCEGNTLNYACFPSSGIRLNVSTVPINTKQQIVVNYDPATGLTTIYRNGIALGSATMGGPTAFGNIIIGRAFASDNRYYKGTIHSFDIYNREATAEELATIFSSFPPRRARLH